MIKSISYWSMPGGLGGTLQIADAIAQTKAAGFAGLELAVAPEGVLTPQTDRATCERYRDMLAASGLAMQTLASGMSWAFSPSHPDAQIRRKSIALHRDSLQRAAWLGAAAMLFVPGAVKIPWDSAYGPVRYDRAVAWAREAVTTLAETAEQVGVDLCIENVWNGLFYSPIEFAAFTLVPRTSAVTLCSAVLALIAFAIAIADPEGFR
jgi:hexulose-6-phosphate isomerase